MDVYRAGGYNDGSDGISPSIYSFAPSTGKILSFSSVSGSWACSAGVTEYTADGTTSSHQITPSGEGKRVVVADHALFHVTQNGGQVQLRRQCPMMVGKLRYRPGEMLIPLGPILLLQKRIGCLHGRNFRQPQVLHQTVLRRVKAAFDAPFGLWRFGQDGTDSQFP